MTNKFIKMYIKEEDDPCIRRLTRAEFKSRLAEPNVQKIKARKADIDFIDMQIHPNQTVYVLADYCSTYPSGSSNWAFEFMFRYRFRYYLFSDVGGN